MTMSRMRFGPHVLRGSPILALVVASFLAIAPTARTEEPLVFAITNARVIPVNGPAIEKGTVVLRNGIIEAVGTGVSIPRDARVIDATGLTVYPGLIDSLSDTGLDQAAAPAAASGGRGAPPPQAPQQAQSPDERQGLTPYQQAADVINPANSKIASARAVGITTAVVAPRRGFFPGQSSIIDLTGSSLGKMVVKNPVALHINLAGGGGFGRAYPGSLMGILAFVKQTLMDAQRYETAWNIYNANPGAERPEYSKALQSLLPALKQQMPVVLTADTPQEVERALDLASPFKLNVMLSGGSEAGPIAPLLAQRKVPVLLTVRFPERERDADPEAEEEFNALRRRMEAPQNAAALAKAGVRFAFQSADMAPRDFIRNVGRAVQAGLDKNAALRALTLTPAEFFGVSDRLGSIEKGKTANVIIMTGDLFDQRSQVKFVFVDGQKFEPEPEPAPSQGGQGRGGPGGPSTAPPAASITGTWSLSLNSPQGPMDVTLDVRQNGTALTGTTSSMVGTAQIVSGSINGSNFHFIVNINSPEIGNISVTFAGTVQGNRMTGTVDVPGMGSMDFTGSKNPGEA